MGFLVDDEGTALMWRGLILTKALEQFLTDVRWGDLDYLLIDMPPGTGDIQMGLARMLPQAEMLVVTTPARAAQKVAVRVADMARRSYMKVVGVVENMTELVLADGSRHAVFGRGGGDALAAEIGAPLVARIPLEPAVSHRRRRRDTPSRSPRPTVAGRRRVPRARGADRRRAAAADRDERLHRAPARPAPLDRRGLTGAASGELPGRLHRRAGDLALGLELEQVRVHLPARRLDQLRVQLAVGVERGDEVVDASPVRP